MYLVCSVACMLLAIFTPWQPVATIFAILFCVTMTLTVLQVFIYYVRPLRSSYLGKTTTAILNTFAVSLLLAGLAVFSFLFR